MKHSGPLDNIRDHFSLAIESLSIPSFYISITGTANAKTEVSKMNKKLGDENGRQAESVKEWN